MRLKRDLLFGFFAGVLAGIFLLPVMKNIEVRIPYQYFLLFLVLPLVSAFWVFAAAKFIPAGSSIFEFAKFIITGGLNTAIDFGILNLLILATGQATGISFSLFKSFSFIGANINSYFWNKFWTFRRNDSVSRQEYAKFFGVSVLGLILNVAASSFVVNLIGPQFGLSQNVWANVGAGVGALVGLFLNFVGYKFVVFEK